ncbi:MAG: hypothetical protein ACPGID_13420 [Rubricella sp.]
MVEGSNPSGLTIFPKAVEEFERLLPGWCWSVGMCSVGAHASCAPDGYGPAAHLLEEVKARDPLGDGFHVDTTDGLPHEALIDVMQQALAYLREQEAK